MADHSAWEDRVPEVNMNVEVRPIPGCAMEFATHGIRPFWYGKCGVIVNTTAGHAYDHDMTVAFFNVTIGGQFYPNIRQTFSFAEIVPVVSTVQRGPHEDH